MSRLLAADQSPALGTELVGRPYDASESAEPVQPPDLSAPTLQAPAPLTQLHRPARVLLGWMHPSEAQLWLVSRRQDATPTPQQVQQAERARAAVAARAVGIHQAGVVQEVAADLAEHIIALQTGPAATLLNEGWRVAITGHTIIPGKLYAKRSASFFSSSAPCAAPGPPQDQSHQSFCRLAGTRKVGAEPCFWDEMA